MPRIVPPAWMRGPSVSSAATSVASMKKPTVAARCSSAIARRQAVGTVQGSEWLGADGFDAQLDLHYAIRDCGGSTVSCYSEIDPEAAVFVPKGQLNGIFSPTDCCPALRETLDKLNLGFAYLDAPEFGQAMARDHAYFKQLVAKVGIKP